MLSFLFVVVGIYFHSFSHALPICQYAGYCMNDGDCYPGNYCSLKLPHYSQCLPKRSSYKTSKCFENYASSPCKSNFDCCDPGAYCNSESFKQCQQPVIGSSKCSNPTGFPPKNVPSKAPVVAPTMSPTTYDDLLKFIAKEFSDFVSLIFSIL